MAGLTFSRKAPCVAGVSIWDPATCTLLPDSYVFKVRGDTPIEPAPEYFDDQDWTEYATDQSQCGPVLVKRGSVKRTEVTVRRCQISIDMETALKGSKARVNVDGGGDTTGYVDTADPTESLCTGTQAPAIFQWVAYPIGRCGSSGFCATAGDQCVIEGWLWGTEPRITQRTQQAVADPAEFSYWAYPISAEAIANLPANISGLVPGGFSAGDFHFENTIDCALIPAPSCDVVPTASLFV